MSTGSRPAGPARRAVLRWAWRLFRREWRQQLLVLALMTVTVAAAVAGATIAVNGASPSSRKFGDADAMAVVDVPNAASTPAAVAAARARFGRVEVIGHSAVPVPGSAVPLDVRAQDPHGGFGRPLLALRSGHYPRRAGEVALTSSAAARLSASVGTRVVLGGVTRRVVGMVENPSDLEDEFALVAPTRGAPSSTLTLLFDTTGERVGAPVRRYDSAAVPAFVTRGGRGPVTALVLIAVTLAMSLVGLVAAAGFVVLAQRRQRQLGLLAAIGATGRHLRLTMLANGALVGAVAAVVGTALGVVGWIVAAPAVETAAHHRIDRLALPWGTVAGCGLIAIAVATAAAWWPARAVARLPVMGALSGRPSGPLPVRRSVALAVALLGLGIVGIVLAHPTGTNVRPLLLVGGVLAIVVAVVLATPAAIRAVSAPAARLPFAARLALRDLYRYQARAAAALAAIALGLAIAIGVVGIAQANVYRADEGNLSDRQVLIRVGDPRTGPDPSLDAAARRALDARAARVAETLGHPSRLALDVAMNPATAGDPNLREPVAEGLAIDANTTRMVTYPYVASPQVLRHLGIDRASVQPDAELLTGRRDDVGLVDTSSRDRTDAVTRVQHVDLPAYRSAPTALVTEAALEAHGWVRARAGWLVESDRPLTGTQIAALRSAAASAGLVIETRSGQDGLAAVRTVATVVGAALALAVVAMAIGLLRGESGRDLQTLTATGASSRTRRSLTASTAGALALLGVVLGTVGAYAALVAGYHARLSKLTPLPLAQLLPLVLGLPIVAAGIGWLLAGREPASLARRALE